MPTATRQAFGRQQAFDFAARSVVWGLSLFGLMRLSWFEAHALLPLTRLQAQVATSALGAPSASIDVTLACSAADAFALCAGAILAYPSRWALRLGGLAGATLLILGLNTIRIGTLGRAAGSAQWFHALHIYVWPAALTVILAVYVFAWMRFTDERRTRVSADALPPRTVQLTTRFAVLTAGTPRALHRGLADLPRELSAFLPLRRSSRARPPGCSIMLASKPAPPPTCCRLRGAASW